MDGIINILKPPGMTSFDVVGYLRGVLKTRKIGHTGTLDPGAVGVLPLCIGNATRVVEYLTEKDKLYRAELALGVVTSTQDAEGEVLGTCKVDAGDKEIREAVMSFVGKYSQIPPMYSAVRIGGKKLYELARNGITVEREPREVVIHSIDVIDIIDNRRVIFDVSCSKGTYIRTLCADIGERLGCGGHMSFLLRLKAGIFDISSAFTLEEIKELSRNGLLDGKLISVDRLFEEYREVTLNEVQEKRLLNGIHIGLGSNEGFSKGEVVRIYGFDSRFLGLGEFYTKQDELLLKIKKRLGI